MTKRKNASCAKYWAATLLGLAGLLHLVRVLLGWQLVINVWSIPGWFSLVTAAIAWTLAVLVVKN